MPHTSPRPSSVVSQEQITYLKSGEVFVVRACSGTISKRYFAFNNAFELKGWSSIKDFPLIGRVTSMHDMERATLTFGKLGSGELALNFNFPSPQIRSPSIFRCFSNRHKITLIVKSQEQLHSWVKAVRLLFAGLDHHPCREGTLGGDNCTICLSNFKNGELISFLNCKHRFHDNCIKEWFQRGAFCPNCKNSNVKFEDGTLDLTIGRYTNV